jgi:hypothetical protein
MPNAFFGHQTFDHRGVAVEVVAGFRQKEFGAAAHAVAC